MRRRTSVIPEPHDLRVEDLEGRVGVRLGPALVTKEGDLDVVDTVPDGCCVYVIVSTQYWEGRKGRKGRGGDALKSADSLSQSGRPPCSS